MPRFFFDIDDGDHLTRDDEGMVCESRQKLGDAAVAVLPEIASDELPNGLNRTFEVKVRDEQGRYVFSATLTLLARWHDEADAIPDLK